MKYSTSQPPNIDNIVAQLSIEEKISLIAGRSIWRIAVVDRLGIYSLKFSDGPSGARGETFGEGVPAAFLPSDVSLGATWDEKLLFEVGELLAEETKSKSASVILAPTMCIHRHPLGGRNFESFSEDPFLTGKLAAAHIRGVQSKGIGATPKHYVANDQETQRFHYNAIISARALREIYLLPFQMVVREADPWCIMTAYDKVNGVHCNMSNELLIDIPRTEWKWDGVFLSDWGGTNSTTESINSGLDLEMPGPPVERFKGAMEQPLAQGAVDLQRIDLSAERMLRLLHKTGRLASRSEEEEICLNLPSQAAKLHEVACAGIVLLNENNALPLQPGESLKKLAVLGPNAKRIVAGGGGSSYIKAPDWTFVHDSICNAFKNQSTRIVHAVGARINRYLPTPMSELTRDPDTGEKGATVDWFLGHEFDGEVLTTTHIGDLYYISFGDVPATMNEAETDFGFRVRTELTPLLTGRHKLSIASVGPSEVYIDRVLCATVSGQFEEKGGLFFTYGSREFLFEKYMVAGRSYNVEMKCQSHDRQLREQLLGLMDPMEEKFQGVRLGYEEQSGIDLPKDAAQIAEDCDAAIIVVGRNKEWETESEDIPIFELPGEQVRLIEEVAKVCERTIVVIQAGTPVEMEPWIHNVQSVLFTWYQGQELGNAAASVITGEFNPSGRLPITFPRRIEDCPAFSSFPGDQHEVPYSEGLHVGYRWWDLHQTLPLFPI